MQSILPNLPFIIQISEGTGFVDADGDPYTPTPLPRMIVRQFAADGSYSELVSLVDDEIAEEADLDGSPLTGGFKYEGTAEQAAENSTLRIGFITTDAALVALGKFFSERWVTVQVANTSGLTEEQAAKINLIGTAAASLPPPPAAEHLTLYLGTVYANADGTAKQVSSTSTLSFQSAARLEFGGHVLGVVVSGTPGAWTFGIEMSVADQANLRAGDYSYTLVPRLSGKSYDSPPVSAGMLHLMSDH